MAVADGEEDYVAQLKEVFDDCDASGKGFIDRKDLVRLCKKLQVEDHAEALVERLIGTSEHRRIGFEEFKDGFVAVLSQCADLISTEDEVSVNSYHDDEAVSPKFVRDGKKYGRRSRPEIHGAETPLDFAELSDIEMDDSYISPTSTPVAGNRKLHTTPTGQDFAFAHEPLAGESFFDANGGDSIAEVYDGEGPVSHSRGTPGEDSRSGLEEVDFDETEALREIWRNQGVGSDGYLSFNELGSICENMGMLDMSDKDMQELFNKLDADRDGKVSFEEFVSGLSQHGEQTVTPSATNRPHSSQSRRQLKFGLSVDNDRRTQTPSILSAITGSGYFSCIDPDQTGYSEPENIIEFWESFGVSHDDVIAVLESLAFDVETRISLQELSSALEQELLNHDQESALYEVAIYSCRHELRYIKGVLETNATEKDKLLEEIESSKKRNDALIREADERQTNQIKQHESLLSSVENKYQELVKSLQSQLEAERETLTSTAQAEKHKLEQEVQNLKNEDRRLKQELSFLQKELSLTEKDLHSHIDKNSTLKKENDRIKKELSSATELHKKVEEMESHITKLNNEQNKFSELRIEELEEENKKLRDRTDELLLELEELKLSISKSSARGEGQRSRRGSLLSDYTMTKADDGTSDHSDADTVDAKRSKFTETTLQEDALRLEILKLKDFHADEISKLKKIHETEKLDLQDAFNNDMKRVEQNSRKLVADFEKKIDEEKLAKTGTESEWRKKYEAETAQLKLAASADRIELVKKLQGEHKEQVYSVRQELNLQCHQEVKAARDQVKEEYKVMQSQLIRKVESFENMFEMGSDALKGKLKADFFQLVEEQTQNEVEVAKRHLESAFQLEKDELFDLLNKEKQSMEDQFNDRLYELEDQMEDIEENVRGECEEEFLEQIQVVQLAFNEEREEYETQINALKAKLTSVERQLEQSVDKKELRKLMQERDQSMNERDDVQLEKNKMMLARNNLERELEKVQRLHKDEKSALQNQIKELHQELATLQTSTAAPSYKQVAPPLNNTCTESELSDKEKTSSESSQLLVKKLSDAEEKIFNLTAELHLAKSQHSREVQDLKLLLNKGPNSDAYSTLQNRLDKEIKRCQELEEALKVQSTEGRRLLLDSQDDNHKTLSTLRFQMDDYKRRLLVTRKSLSEVTEKLKEQMLKTTKSDNLVRELYIENANLVEALFVTEKRQKVAEKAQFRHQTKYESLVKEFTNFMPAVINSVSHGQ